MKKKLIVLLTMLGALAQTSFALELTGRETPVESKECKFSTQLTQKSKAVPTQRISKPTDSRATANSGV